MPPPFKKLYFASDAFSYLKSNNPPSESVRACLTKLLEEIIKGKQPLYQHPTKKEFYLPIIGCNHTIYITVDKHNNLIITDIVALE